MTLAEVELDVMETLGVPNSSRWKDAIRMARKAMLKENPAGMIRNITKKHRWKMDGNEVDDFAFSIGTHNGPMCEVCGFSFCEYCNPELWDDKNCYERVDCACPMCQNEVSETDKWCGNCGQHLEGANHETDSCN